MAPVAEVTVVEVEPGTFTVTISDGAATTRHTVRVPAALPRSLGCGHVPVVELVRRSMAFLLEREPPTSILSSFSLDQIGHYFPEFPDTIRRSLSDETGP